MFYKFKVKHFMALPIELQDYIFLFCDPTVLENTRSLQSDHVKNTTRYFSFDNNLSKSNLRWLFIDNIRFA
jgi:hypothetical protein